MATTLRITTILLLIVSKISVVSAQSIVNFAYVPLRPERCADQFLPGETITLTAVLRASGFNASDWPMSKIVIEYNHENICELNIKVDGCGEKSEDVNMLDEDELGQGEKEGQSQLSRQQQQQQHQELCGRCVFKQNRDYSVEFKVKSHILDAFPRFRLVWYGTSSQIASDTISITHPHTMPTFVHTGNTFDIYYKEASDSKSFFVETRSIQDVLFIDSGFVFENPLLFVGEVHVRQHPKCAGRFDSFAVCVDFRQLDSADNGMDLSRDVVIATNDDECFNSGVLKCDLRFRTRNHNCDVVMVEDERGKDGRKITINCKVGFVTSGQAPKVYGNVTPFVKPKSKNSEWVRVFPQSVTFSVRQEKNCDTVFYTWSGVLDSALRNEPEELEMKFEISFVSEPLLDRCEGYELNSTDLPTYFSPHFFPDDETKHENLGDGSSEDSDEDKDESANEEEIEDFNLALAIGVSVIALAIITVIVVFVVWQRRKRINKNRNKNMSPRI